MSSDAREPPADATPGGAVADEAALIATFYGRRDKMSEATIPDVWHDPENNKFLYRFDPPAAHDTTIIQLALNIAGSADTAWETARQRLESLLDTTNLPRLWWGYTLTYQAIVAPGVGADFALGKLQPSIRRLHSSESLQPLAQANMSGGKVWLLDIPTHGGGLEAATVYVALSQPDKEEELVKAIYGPDAGLLMPDLIAHKSYYQMREYRGEKVQRGFEEGISLYPSSRC